jgi:hypothetical protein
MLHLRRILHINRPMTPVQINNDGYRHCGFCRSNRDDEYGKENPVQLIRPEIFIECDEIDVDTVQYELNRHQHRYHVAAGEKAVHADEEKGSAEEEDIT